MADVITNIPVKRLPSSFELQEKIKATGILKGTKASGAAATDPATVESAIEADVLALLTAAGIRGKTAWGDYRGIFDATNNFAEIDWPEGDDPTYIADRLSSKIPVYNDWAIVQVKIDSTVDPLQGIRIYEYSGVWATDGVSGWKHRYAVVTPAGLALKANIDSPTLTGTPKSPTPSSSAESTQIATVGYVNSHTSAADAAAVAITGEYVKTPETTTVTAEGAGEDKSVEYTTSDDCYLVVVATRAISGQVETLAIGDHVIGKRDLGAVRGGEPDSFGTPIKKGITVKYTAYLSEGDTITFAEYKLSSIAPQTQFPDYEATGTPVVSGVAVGELGWVIFSHVDGAEAEATIDGKVVFSCGKTGDTNSAVVPVSREDAVVFDSTKITATFYPAKALQAKVSVTVTPHVTTGVKIATINIGGTDYEIWAPNSATAESAPVVINGEYAKDPVTVTVTEDEAAYRDITHECLSDCFLVIVAQRAVSGNVETVSIGTKVIGKRDVGVTRGNEPDSFGFPIKKGTTVTYNAYVTKNDTITFYEYKLTSVAPQTQFPAYSSAGTDITTGYTATDIGWIIFKNTSGTAGSAKVNDKVVFSSSASTESNTGIVPVSIDDVVTFDSGITAKLFPVKTIQAKVSVEVTPELTSGTLIATIAIAGTTYPIYVPNTATSHVHTPDYNNVVSVFNDSTITEDQTEQTSTGTGAFADSAGYILWESKGNIGEAYIKLALTGSDLTLASIVSFKDATGMVVVPKGATIKHLHMQKLTFVKQILS